MNAVITTKELATKNAEARDTERVRRLVEAIERKIAREWVPGSRVIVYPEEILADEQMDIRRATIDTVLNLYRSSGWEANFSTSQRDGSWMEIK